MPVGIIINVTAVILGALIGSVVKDRLPDDLKTGLTMIFGIALSP